MGLLLSYIILACPFSRIIKLKNFIIDTFCNIAYFVDSSGLLEIIPEFLLIVFILYSLITVFNDVEKSMFQFYRWCLLFLIIFVYLFIMMYFLFPTTKILFGFTWINSNFTVFSKMFVIILTLLVLFISTNKIKKGKSLVCILEFPLIIGFSVLFLFLLNSSYDFFSVYLAIEGLSLTLYSMCAMMHQEIVSVEASVKYYSLGAISTGIMLFGISLLFGLVGSLDFFEIQVFLGSSKISNILLELKISIMCILFGLFFKMSIFPCHVWVADVYEGVWTPITAFFAVVVKIGLLLFFIRVVYSVFFNFLFAIQHLLVYSALGSIFVGTFGALKQVRIKRFIAFTSINQVGFIMLGISCCNLAGLIASLVYIILYSIMGVSFFAILLNLEHVANKRSMIYISDFYGMSLHNKETSKHLVITILSMGGLPPLGGFVGKFFIYLAAIEARLDWVVLLSMLISVVSVYYYLNLIRHIWFEKTSFIKVYYFNKNVTLKILLRLISLILCFFILFLPNIFSFVTKLAVSCVFPVFVF